MNDSSSDENEQSSSTTDSLPSLAGDEEAISETDTQHARPPSEWPYTIGQAQEIDISKLRHRGTEAHKTTLPKMSISAIMNDADATEQMHRDSVARLSPIAESGDELVGLASDSELGDYSADVPCVFTT